ncbi:MAG TPA: TorF family putative porin [Thermoanaerobaculia bacterium]|nr:TorF family putative porin [Thermoanaerobaculia bacterium]
MASNGFPLFLAGAVAAALAWPGLTGAQATSAHTVAGNMSIVSDYRFRGISQTFVQPAIQCGIDYSHASGFYLGNWNSNVSGVSFVDGAIEMDIYGGFRKGFGEATLDVGLLQYYYPNARAEGAKYDTLEGYAGVSWRWLTVKYSHTFSDWFGVQAGATGSAGSGYIDLSASYEIAPKLMLAGHIGQQKVKNFSNLDYTDYKIGLTYDLNGWGLGAAYIDTDAGVFYTGATAASGKSIDLGKSTVVLSVSKLF